MPGRAPDSLRVLTLNVWARGGDWDAPGEPGDTFTPDNPLVADPDWPFRRIDYILVRCGDHGGPTLGIRSCKRVFDEPIDGVWASDHFGVTADVGPPTR